MYIRNILIFLLTAIPIFSSSWAASTSFYYYTQAQRIDTLNSIFQAVQSRYSLWEIKMLNMEIDGEQIFRKALSEEELHFDVEGPVAKAESNMMYHDRVTKLIASFKDTHFRAQENTPRPNILNGVSLSPYFEGGTTKVLVSQISKKILDYGRVLSGNESLGKIEVGDTLVAGKWP